MAERYVSIFPDEGLDPAAWMNSLMQGKNDTEDDLQQARESFGNRNSLRKSVGEVRGSPRYSTHDMKLLGIDVNQFAIDEESEEDFSFTDEQPDHLAPFESMFKPSEMRCLALVAHNHMKPAMKEFVINNKELLKKFRLTGTNSTMTMLKETFGDDPKVKYGPTCTSGPLGGDAQLCAQMCLEDIGAIVFFMDPMSAHPHQADIDSLVRLSNVHNVLIMPNPTSAYATLHTLRIALKEGNDWMIPSFFMTLESPAVKEYKDAQKAVIQKMVDLK